VDLAGEILGYQRIAAVVAGGLLILYGLVSLFNILPLLAENGGPIFARVAGLLRGRSPNNAFLTGVLLGFLPCGLVYSAVIAAAARGGALDGALGLLLFGAGTLPAMLGLSVVDELLARHRALINRLSMIFILVMGGWFVWQGLAG
jgi:sulfite exporter TauE/SafE